MKAKFVLMVCMLYSFSITATAQSRYSSDLLSYLSGVKYATVTPLRSGIPTNWGTAAKNAIDHFLRDNQIVLYTDGVTRNECDIVRVKYEFNMGGILRDYMKDFKLIFVACDGKERVFKLGHNPSFVFNAPWKRCTKKIYRALKAAIPLRNMTYDIQNRITLEEEKFYWDELAVRSYFANNSDLESVEGIYDVANDIEAKYRLALIKEDNFYKLIYLSGAPTGGIWVVGDIKAFLYPTATDQYFQTVNYYSALKIPYENVYIELHGGAMTVNFPDQKPAFYLKIFPKE